MMLESKGLGGLDLELAALELVENKLGKSRMELKFSGGVPFLLAWACLRK